MGETTNSQYIHADITTMLFCSKREFLCKEKGGIEYNTFFDITKNTYFNKMAAQPLATLPINKIFNR